MSDDKLIEDMADIIQATVTQALLDYDIPPEQIVCDVEMRHATVVTAQAALDVAKAQIRDEVLEEAACIADGEGCDGNYLKFTSFGFGASFSNDTAFVRNMARVAQGIRAMKEATNEKG